jgi:outer membrane protein OmpA-like peptidoglycan-associated protein
VNARWSAYYAPDTPLALARARQVLHPPAGVALDLKDGVLSIAGPAPLPWLAEAGRMAPLIPGVSRLDAAASLDAIARQQIAIMESRTPMFVKGQAALSPGEDVVLQQIIDAAGALRGAAALAGRAFRIDVVGHADADGAAETNMPLSQARAAFVRNALAAGGGRFDVISTGVGSDQPLGPSSTESEKQRNRCVTIRVTPIEAAAGKDARP